MWSERTFTIDDYLAAKALDLRRAGRSASVDVMFAYRDALTRAERLIGRPLAAMELVEAESLWQRLPPGERREVIGALRDAFAWAIINGRYAGPNPFDGGLPPRIPLQPPPLLSVEEVQRVLSRIPSPKHRLIFALQAAGDVRLGQVLELQVGDVLEDGVLVVGEGGRKRYVPVRADVMEPLQQFAADRPPDEYVFRPDAGPTRGENVPTGPKGLYAAFREASRRAGFDPDVVSPEVLRHALATHAAQVTTGQEAGQDLLRPAAPTTARDPERDLGHRSDTDSVRQPDLVHALDRALER